MRIGVDVGGTNTDAVVMRGDRLLAAVKRSTTDDIAAGVVNAVKAALDEAGVRASEIEALMLGTTQFTNAVVRRRDLERVGVIRVGAQSARALPIAAKWPEDLAGPVVAETVQVDGGAEYDGAPIVPLDEVATADAIARFVKNGVHAFAITSVFSPVNPAMEQRVAEMAHAAAPEAKIALSHEIGGLGLYQRENATILNAALLSLAERVTAAFRAAFAELNLSCPFLISQNDGTLMRASFAQSYPVATFSSGPTNSMRGAAFLTGERDAMVIDIGGTTSDIGMLINGFPRPSGVAVSIGGVLTNFRMPDVLAVGLGGGSIVSDDGQSIGPESVGAALTHKGLAFGGNVMTTSDILVAARRATLGDRAVNLDQAVVSTALARMREILAEGVDKMKTSPSPLPVIVVGGGAFLAPDDLPGAERTLRPENAGVANAIGAAFAQIGAEAEVVYMRAHGGRDEALTEVKRRACERAVEAGANPQTTDIVHIDETPMSYLDAGGAIIKARAIGDADLSRLNAAGARS